MREALAGLTVRGRGFVVAGTTAVLCAIIVGHTSLVRVGVLVVTLPLVTAFFLARGGYRLSLVRSVNPAQVSAGQRATVELSITNEGRTPSGALLLEEQLPAALGPRPRILLEGVRHGWTRGVTYSIEPRVRGRFEIGPMSVRVSDPFGLILLGRTFQTTVGLTVTPPLTTLPEISITGSHSSTGDNRPRAFTTGSSEDVTIREYRRGDDLRRVHWPSSARAGELMVRREEQPWQARATVFLDNRAESHRGQGLSSSFEYSVAAAASVSVHLSQRGYSVRLVCAGGELVPANTHAGDQSATRLLEALATIEAMPTPNLDTSWLAEMAGGSTLVGIFGRLHAHDQPVLRRMSNHAGAALALALDVGQWQPVPEPPSHPEGALTRLGFRAVTVTPGSRLDHSWAALGKPRAQRKAPVPASPATASSAGGGHPL